MSVAELTPEELDNAIEAKYQELFAVRDALYALSRQQDATFQLFMVADDIHAEITRLEAKKKNARRQARTSD